MRICLLVCVFYLLVSVTKQSDRQARTYSRTVNANKDDDSTKLVMAHTGVDVWKIDPNGPVDMRMSSRLFSLVQEYVPECHLLIDSVEAHVQEAELGMLSPEQNQEIWEQAVIDEVEDETHKPFKSSYTSEAESYKSPEKWFDSYHDLGSIQEWYHSLAKDNPSLVRYVPSIGKTAEERDLVAVHITATSAPKRPRLYLQCLIHAREWISGSTCMYIANHMVTKYGKDDKVTELLKAMEVVMVPVVNPDGYAYSWKNDRLWRKNRVQHPQMACIGVDLNRNYPMGWGMQEVQSSSSMDESCGQVYGGPNPLSEEEAKHISSYFKKNGPVVAAIDFHSFGQLVLRPWGYTTKNSIEEKTMSSVGQALVEEIGKVNGKHYVSERGIDLYQACGLASDWFYSDEAASTNKGIRTAAFTIELRDQGGYGFLLPKEQIVPTAQEALAAVILFADTMRKNPLTYKAETKSQQWEYGYK